MLYEVIQEVMLTLWHKADQFDPKRSSLTTWVYRIARNRYIDSVRSESRPELNPDDPALVPPTCPLPDDQVAEIGGALFDELSDTTDDDALLEAVMQRIDKPAPAAEQPMPPLPADMPTLPRPSLDQLSRGGGAARWRYLIPGVRYIDLPIELMGEVGGRQNKHTGE